MSTTGFLDKLDEYRDRRLNHEAARKYTVVVDGVEHNAGEYRDNMADVLEELSDAYNITAIAQKRAVRSDCDIDVIRRYSRLLDSIERLMTDTFDIRRLLPSDLVRDQPEILGEKTPKRIVTLEEVGL
jgi:hypothetical protein